MRDAVAKANLKFRPGHGELLRWVDQEGVPLLMFSAGIAGTHDTKRVKYRDTRWWQGVRFVGLLLHALRRFVAVAGTICRFFPCWETCVRRRMVCASRWRERVSVPRAGVLSFACRRARPPKIYFCPAPRTCWWPRKITLRLQNRSVCSSPARRGGRCMERGEGKTGGLQRQTQVYSPTAHF